MHTDRHTDTRSYSDVKGLSDEMERAACASAVVREAGAEREGCV